MNVFLVRISAIGWSLCITFSKVCSGDRDLGHIVSVDEQVLHTRHEGDDCYSQGAEGDVNNIPATSSACIPHQAISC